ncbi:MAG: toxin-antitoxin system YwqK family antitoxin [Flavobacteriales bacterium]|nr:toxin-antitoxin system YwqK family antitoxin [Flavobacteriales bacterium]
MKLSILITLFFSFTSVLFGQDTNYTDSKGMKQGFWIKKFENGNTRYTGQFKDNKPYGTFIYYYENGKTSSIMNYDGNTARTTVFYEEGKIKAKGNYKNQQKDSIWNYYSLADFKISEELYVNGKKQGTVKNFFQDGKIAEQKEFVNDIEEGDWKQFYENGQLRMVSTYTKGSLEGKSYYYDRTGKKMIEGNFYHDVRHGAWLYFDEKGEITKKEIFINGTLQGEPNLIKEDQEIRESQDQLEFEDMLPPRN